MLRDHTVLGIIDSYRDYVTTPKGGAAQRQYIVNTVSSACPSLAPLIDSLVKYAYNANPHLENWTGWLAAPKGDICIGKPPSLVHKRHDIGSFLVL